METKSNQCVTTIHAHTQENAFVVDGVHDDDDDDDDDDVCDADVCDDAFTMRNVDEDANVKKYHHEDDRRRKFDDARSKRRRRRARRGVDDGTNDDDAMRAWTRATTTRGDDRATRGE